MQIHLYKPVSDRAQVRNVSAPASARTSSDQHRARSAAPSSSVERGKGHGVREIKIPLTIGDRGAALIVEMLDASASRSARSAFWSWWARHPVRKATIERINGAAVIAPTQSASCRGQSPRPAGWTPKKSTSTETFIVGQQVGKYTFASMVDRVSITGGIVVKAGRSDPARRQHVLGEHHPRRRSVIMILDPKRHCPASGRRLA